MWSTFGWHAASEAPKWPTTSVLLLVVAKKKSEEMFRPKEK